MLPEASAAPFAATLGRAVTRLRARHLLRAAAAGLSAAAAIAVLFDLLRASSRQAAAAAMTAAISCAAVRYVRLRDQRTTRAAARAVEAADPDLRNLVVTAGELLECPGPARPYMRARVLGEASRRTAGLNLARVVPLVRDAAVALAAAAVLIAVLAIGVGPVRRPGSEGSPPVAAGGAARATAITIDLAPPAYTGRPAARLIDPASVDAWAGTRALIHLPMGGKPVVRLNGTELPVGADGVARALLVESGYLAIEAGALHRLLPLTVTPDRAPAVRIVAPAKDMRVATNAVSIPIAAEAVDDLALRSLELRYTIVSGAGEQFSFTEGTMAAALTRGSDQAWRIETRLSPAQMKLEPGDALVYRAVAADRRPGDAGVASSDTFFVEIAGPGDVPLAGVDMPPDKERYALSEAMIVLKIERLQARERGLPRAALAEAAGDIAAEQRAVRANFVFLLGGEIEDENVEAETSSEIAEGRFQNSARQEIVAATVLMGRVERALAALSTKDALPLARRAVAALQRAFGHSRYLLRALPARGRIDPARRLSGDLAAAADWRRDLAPPATDPQTDAARSALLALIAAARALDEPAGPPPDLAAALSRLGERILSLAGRAADLEQAARDVMAARESVSAGHVAAARAALQRAAGPLVARAQRGRIDGRAADGDAARLAGAAALLDRAGPSPAPRPGGGRR